MPKSKEKNNWKFDGSKEGVGHYGGDLIYTNRNEKTKYKKRVIMLDFSVPNRAIIFYMKGRLDGIHKYSKKFHVKLKPSTYKKLRKLFKH